ncbi:MAG TPA: hypothetical protein PK992_11205 [Planctomycetaceae bacterium]|nr:hypothetical protein [Planctomycetaceae bacterium]
MRKVYRNLSAIVVAALLQNAFAAQQEVPHELPGLHNLVRLSDEVYSGSEPVGEAAFSSLQQLGIRTILSVDGATPRIDLAKKYGIAYAHVPFGYDAIPLTAQLSLTCAARLSKTPLYIHCHHGKHRGPAAAAIVCRAKGLVDVAGALKIMENAGTSREYKGLWLDVERYVVPSRDVELPPLLEVSEVEALPAAMARIDRNFDNLKLCQAADWQTPADHPDLVAVQEALQLQESLHEAGRRLSEVEHAAEYDTTFRNWLSESDRVAKQLRASLKENDSAAATTAFTNLQQTCRQCHVKYRD